MLTALAACSLFLASAPSAARLAPDVQFALASSSAAESSGGVAVRVTLSAIHTLDVSVPYTFGGTAKPGKDYSAAPPPLLIPSGQLSADVIVTLLDDGQFEPSESLLIVLGSPTNATLGVVTTHTLSIQDDDQPLGNSGRLPLVRPLEIEPPALSFAALRSGDVSAPVTLTVSNPNAQPILLSAAELLGPQAAGFGVVPSSALPLSLLGGESTQLELTFQPAAKGPHAATLGLVQVPQARIPASAPLAGIAFGPVGAEVLVNAGGDAHLATTGETWTADYGYTLPGNLMNSFGLPVQGTLEQGLYQCARVATNLHWEFELPAGHYSVRLHFAELQHDTSGKRVFDVVVENQLVRDDLDLWAQVGKLAALQVVTMVEVADGKLDLDLSASIGQALLCAIEVRSTGSIQATPAAVDFGVIDVGQVVPIDVQLENVGLNALHASSLTIKTVKGNGQDFSVELGAFQYPGSSSTTSYTVDLDLQPDETALARIWFSPSAHDFHELRIELRGNFPTFKLTVAGGAGAGGDPFLHTVLSVPPQVVDYDLSGSEPVLLDGSGSHTHQPGHFLTGWEWREGPALVAVGEEVSAPFALGPHAIELTILDDNRPPHSLSGGTGFEVFPVDVVPGVLTLYYLPGAGQTPAGLLDAVPANPDFAEVRPGLAVDDANGVGSSGIPGNVMVRALCTLHVAAGGTYAFVCIGGHDLRLEIDGSPVGGPIALSAGAHALEARWAVASTQELPLEVLSDLSGGALAPIDPSLLTHDQRDTPPVINLMPDEGINLGGNQIAIDGFGFFPGDQVVVHWGNLDLALSDFGSWSAERIEFLSPPGSGIIDVSVQTPHGTSNLWQFEYKANGPVPIAFDPVPGLGVNQATAAAWGPDGRLYVVSRDGTLHAVTYASDYSVQSAQVYPGVSMLANHEALGLAFDPFDPPGSVRVYVAHSETFAQGGGGFSGPSPYPGRISRLDGPAFDSPVPVVTNLPTSNHDHAVNVMVFDDNGDLLVCMGGNTNAGVQSLSMGNLPESPLSGAILKVELSRPDFNGAISYVETATGQVNMNQVFGGVVDVAAGVHVSVHASGIRNAYDLVLTTWGELYCTDNGPNATFGPASTGPSSQTAWHPSDVDELLRVEYGRYHGHPNRNRGRTIDIENVYFDTNASAVPGFTQHIGTLQSSSNGVVEYTASTFNDQMRGDLLVQRFDDLTIRVQLTPDKQSILSKGPLPFAPDALDVLTGPGGAVIAIDYLHNAVKTYVPQDAGAVGLTVYDIFPWRAPAQGGVPFVIGGSGFGTLSDTSVTIGGHPATLTSVAPTRIRGVVPANGGPSAGLVDVVVTLGAITKPLGGAFRYLPNSRGAALGQWSSLPVLPVPLGEVAAGVIDGKLFVVGETSVKTLACDLASATWDQTLAVRPFVGHHHASEVWNGKWYLIGGLGAGMGKVQIYDPQANSWSLGANMPWSGGSVSTCRIGDKIYTAGGILGGTTVDDCAVYDPIANTWTPRAPMPVGKGRNHAAAGTDGQRFWIFGGRGIGSGAGNVVANGFSDVHLYDPVTNSWTASYQSGSPLVPLPIGRGGTGKAAFYKGDFWVIGGETLNGPGANAANVYDRVDVYDPTSHSWRLETPMPTARHGIFPVIYQGRIHVAGGGVAAGFSNSNVFEVFYKP